LVPSDGPPARKVSPGSASSSSAPAEKSAALLIALNLGQPLQGAKSGAPSLCRQAVWSDPNNLRSGSSCERKFPQKWVKSWVIGGGKPASGGQRDGTYWGSSKCQAIPGAACVRPNWA